MIKEIFKTEMKYGPRGKHTLKVTADYQYDEYVVNQNNDYVDIKIWHDDRCTGSVQLAFKDFESIYLAIKAERD
jgi:hypothetical protein